jgi:hypothetical protein
LGVTKTLGGFRKFFKNLKEMQNPPRVLQAAFVYKMKITFAGRIYLQKIKWRGLLKFKKL